MTQHTSRRSLTARLLAGAALFAVAALAHAQYVWVDEKGIKQFSDQPPPPSVPLKRILKAPGELKKAIEQQSAAGAEADGEAVAPADAGKSKAPPSLAERNADYNKRKADAAEKEKKTAEETKRKEANARNCDEMRRAQRTLESGERITRTDKNGERNYMGDDERAAETARNKRALGECN
ncbi:MAG: DUF4124 domain-containing protein [Pseudomonadota bacterium]